MRYRVYIAGPISRGNLLDNVNQATDAFILLAKAGLAPMCPHWSVYSKPAISYSESNQSILCIGTIQGNPFMSHADWIGVDLAWVQVADCLLRLPGESRGADLEVEHAKKHEIPVFHSVDEVLAWVNR